MSVSCSGLGRTSNERVYETLQARLVRGELGRRRARCSLHELRDRRSASRAARSTTRSRGSSSEGLLTGRRSRRGYYVTPADRGGDRRGLRRPPRARAAARPTRGRARRPATACAASASSHEATADRRLARRSGTRPTPPSTSTRSTSPANALLSRFYRELSVNLMMQVIRGGELEGGSSRRARAPATPSPSRRAFGELDVARSRVPRPLPHRRRRA